MTRPVASRVVALAIAAVGGATIAGALVSQYGFGFVPCKLCLVQRWPYYVGVPMAVATALLPAGTARRLGFVALALLFLASAGLGLHHAGVEWGFWPGPTDCGSGGATAGSVDDLLREIDRAQVASCDTPALHVLGLSLAVWNALISLGLAGLAALSAIDQGSSSVSQYR